MIRQKCTQANHLTYSLPQSQFRQGRPIGCWQQIAAMRSQEWHLPSIFWSGLEWPRTTGPAFAGSNSHSPTNRPHEKFTWQLASHAWELPGPKIINNSPWKLGLLRLEQIYVNHMSPSWTQKNIPLLHCPAVGRICMWNNWNLFNWAYKITLLDQVLQS